MARPSLPLPGILQVAPVVKQRKWGWVCFPSGQQRAGNGAPGGEARQPEALSCRVTMTVQPGPLGAHTTKLSMLALLSRLGGEDKAERHRCIGLGEDALVSS